MADFVKVYVSHADPVNQTRRPLATFINRRYIVMWGNEGKGTVIHVEGMKPMVVVETAEEIAEMFETAQRVV